MEFETAYSVENIGFQPIKASIDLPVELRDRLDSAAREKGISRDEMLSIMLDAENLPQSESVREAITLGAKKEDLIQSGMEWSAKLYLSQRKSKEESGINLSDLSDVELETLDPAISKKIGGVAEEKLLRMITKLEGWNDIHEGKRYMMISITPSYLMGLRDEMKDLTQGKITGLNRNQVFAYFAQAKSSTTPRALSQSHNREVDAIAFGIQAHEELISELLDPSKSEKFRRYLIA